MKMSFPQSPRLRPAGTGSSGNPEDKRNGFLRNKYWAGSVKHGMTGRRGFSGKVSSLKLEVQNFFKELPTVYCSPPHPPLRKGGRRGGNKGFTPHHVCSAGFTLIETIIVMVVVAILAAVVILRNPFDSIKLSSATRKVAADIRYVQKLAISNQTRAGIVFSGISYSVYPNITDLATLAESPGDTCSSDGANKFVVNFTQPRCSSFSNVTIAPNPLTIAFNSLGKPVNSSGGSLTTQTVTVSYKGNDKSITVEEETGRVSIQ